MKETVCVSGIPSDSVITIVVNSGTSGSGFVGVNVTTVVALSYGNEAVGVNVITVSSSPTEKVNVVTSGSTGSSLVCE